jgi:ATP-dependent Clp protease ATP-binding subunit ClpA
MGVNTEELRQQTEERLVAGPGRKNPRLHLTEQSQRIADLWPQEATRSGAGLIGTEHQFLALIRRAEGVVAEVIALQGISEETFRAQVAALP